MRWRTSRRSRARASATVTFVDPHTVNHLRRSPVPGFCCRSRCFEHACGLHVVELDHRLLRLGGEAAWNARLQLGTKHVVAKRLPALLGVVNRQDGEPAGRGTGSVEELTLGELGAARMNGGKRCLVLLLGAAGE